MFQTITWNVITSIIFLLHLYAHTYCPFRLQQQKMHHSIGRILFHHGNNIVIPLITPSCVIQFTVTTKLIVVQSFQLSE